MTGCKVHNASKYSFIFIYLHITIQHETKLMIEEQVSLKITRYQLPSMYLVCFGHYLGIYVESKIIWLKPSKATATYVVSVKENT